MITPYEREVNEAMVQGFTQNGFQVTKLVGFAMTDEQEKLDIVFEYIRDCVLEHFNACTNDALFISCTGLTIVDHIEQLERLIGRPVLTSNQTSAWHVMQLLTGGGEKMPKIRGFGQLFDHDLK